MLDLLREQSWMNISDDEVPSSVRQSTVRDYNYERFDESVNQEDDYNDSGIQDSSFENVPIQT